MDYCNRKSVATLVFIFIYEVERHLKMFFQLKMSETERKKRKQPKQETLQMIL